MKIFGNQLFHTEIVLYHTTTKKCEACEKFAKTMTDLSKRYETAVRFIQVDCPRLRDSNKNSPISHCDGKNDHKLPVVEFHPFKTSESHENSNKVEVYSGEPQQKALEDFMNENFTQFLAKINCKNCVKKF